MAEGKLDYYVKVNVPIDRLQRNPSERREVYKYDGPIDLNECGGRVYKVITNVLLLFVTRDILIFSSELQF